MPRSKILCYIGKCEESAKSYSNYVRSFLCMLLSFFCVLIKTFRDTNKRVCLKGRKKASALTFPYGRVMHDGLLTYNKTLIYVRQNYNHNPHASSEVF